MSYAINMAALRRRVAAFMRQLERQVPPERGVCWRTPFNASQRAWRERI